jgi:hypothetical protein
VQTKASVISQRWPDFIDGACDGIVMSFACWTIYYQIALALQFSMLSAGWPWILLTTMLVLGFGLRASLEGDVTSAVTRSVKASPVSASRWTIALSASFLLVGLLQIRRSWGVWPIAITVIALLVMQLAWWMVESRSAAARSRPIRGPAKTSFRPALREDVPRWALPGNQLGRKHDGLGPSMAAHVFALVVSVGLGVLGSFLLRPDADDAYYVNRATWVANHGTAALNDTMFSPNTLPPSFGGGVPTPSIEAVQGVVAHAFNIQAPTLCYLLAVPVLGTLLGWTTWRVIRWWVQRRWALAMAGAVLFLLASADAIIGSYTLGRIWQGKATAYAILLPLVWLLLSRLASRASRFDVVMLLASGIAFVGLTSSSSLLAPLIVAASLLAALILRSKPLALGALAFLMAPLVNGILQVAGPPIGGGGGNTTRSQIAAFEIAFGVSVPMLLLAVAAMVLTPRLVRGPSGILLGCGAIATMVALLPGVFEAVAALTGAGAVAWRLLIGMPTWILVGLLATVPDFASARSSDGRNQILRIIAVCLSGLVFLVPIVWGTWLWERTGASFTSRPTWKVDQTALADVRAARQLEVAEGLWLLPRTQMEILAISAVGPFSVVPRGYYLQTLQVPAEELDDRLVLYRLVLGRGVSPARVRLALDRLDVSLACVPVTNKRAQGILSQAVDEDLESVSQMRCHVTRPGDRAR